MVRWLKVVVSSLIGTAGLLFTIATIRTLSLDPNGGLQLARWEKTNMSLVLDEHQRQELLANFKGNSCLSGGPMWTQVDPGGLANTPL